MTDPQKKPLEERSELDFFELEEDTTKPSSSQKSKQLRSDIPELISCSAIGKLVNKDYRTIKTSLQKLGLEFNKGSVVTLSIFEYIISEAEKFDKRKNRALQDPVVVVEGDEELVDEDDWTVGGFQNKNNPNNFKLFCEGQKKYLEVQILKGKYLPIADVMQSAYNTILNMVLLFEGLQDKVDDYFDDPDVSDQARDYIRFCRNESYKHLQSVIKTFPVNEADDEELEKFKELIKQSISSSSGEDVDIESTVQTDLPEES